MTLEAMSAGCAIVSTNTGAEFLKNGENCLLADVGDVPALTSAVKKLYNDSDLTEKLVRNSCATADKVADPTDYINNWNKIIGDLF
jgi:glycosyltransferase involved in cell wall biosynthesis